MLRAVGPYLNPLRKAIHALKYDGLTVLAKPLAELVLAHWPAMGLAPTVLVPVPLHAARLRQRGYNQAELLARHLGTALSLPVQPHWLRRTRRTSAQVGLHWDARWANVRDAFSCPTPEVIRGERVLLIDDVTTTGATLQACADAVHRAGGSQIAALTIARVGRRRLLPDMARRSPAGRSARS